jgi:hypothetical protein
MHVDEKVWNRFLSNGSVSISEGAGHTGGKISK